MKNTLNKEELQVLANETLDQFPNAKKVFATPDGNVFLEENRANLHVGKKGIVIPFDRPLKKSDTKESKETDKPAKAEDQIKAIEAATSLEELEAFKQDNRATVKKALENKIESLTEVK